jgi:glycosyltransferase involved in cell wall biosynthesis
MGRNEAEIHPLHDLSSPQLRKKTLEHYSQLQPFKFDPSLPIANRSRPISVTIPAYNEEEVLTQTIQSLDISSQHAGNIAEVIIVDNMSTDSTAQIVRDAHSCVTPVTLMQNPIKGIASTRKMGMDQVFLHHIVNDVQNTNRRVLVMTDGDTQFPIDFIKSYMELFEGKNPDMVTGVYEYPAWVDEGIFSLTGISDFYKTLSQISLFLMQHSMSIAPTIGSNSGIEVGSYAAVDGINQDLKRSEDHDLGKRVRTKKGHIEIIPSVVYTSPRRALVAMAKHVDFAHTNLLNEDIRCNDSQLLDLALRSNSKDAWLDEQKLREGYIVFGRIALPFLSGELELTHMQNFFGIKHPFVEILSALGKEKLKDEASSGRWSQEKLEKIAKEFSFHFSHLLTNSVKNYI